MSPREALGLLDQNVARLAGTREDHVKLQSAVIVLDQLVLDAEVKARALANDVENAAKKVVEATETKSGAKSNAK
jgi:hypothetical protein